MMRELGKQEAFRESERAWHLARKRSPRSLPSSLPLGPDLSSSTELARLELAALLT